MPSVKPITQETENGRTKKISDNFSENKNEKCDNLESNKMELDKSTLLNTEKTERITTVYYV